MIALVREHINLQATQPSAAVPERRQVLDETLHIGHQQLGKLKWLASAHARMLFVLVGGFQGREATFGRQALP